MSLIYQSLQKLQPGEKVPSTGGPPGAPASKFRLRSALWVLLGTALLGACAYTAWIVSGSQSPQASPPPSAEMNSESNPSQSADPPSAGNASQGGPGEKNSAKRSANTNKTDQLFTKKLATVPTENKEPGLLHFSCRRNGTRARLSLEFDREPSSPETNWDNQTQTLGLAFTRATANTSHSLLEQATRAGLDLSLISSDPLRLRLKAPELREHSGFTLPGSGNYGPRFILALRFAPNKKLESDPGRQSRRSRTREPHSGSGSTPVKQAGENETQRDRSRQPESEKEQKDSGSLEIASGTRAQQSSERETEESEVKRLLEQKRFSRAAELLRRRLRRNPKNTALRTRYAKILISEQRYRRALQALQVKNPPNVQENTAYYALAAYAQRKLERHERAAQIYQTLVENEPQKGKWWMGLGLCLERSGRIQGAQKAYERALGSSGLDKDVRDFLQQRKKRLDQGQAED